MRHWRAAFAPLAFFISAACGGQGVSSPTPPPTTAAPVLASEPLTIDLPINPADSVSIGYGIWPFGVHGGDHALDGHSGFDFEYRVGAPVLAAADGIVDNRIPDAHDATRISLQLRHKRSFGDYLTDYSNLANVPAELTPGATVTRGQALGTAGTFPGGGSAMTHFQLGDPMLRGNATIIASPESYFTPAARAQLDAIFRTASYGTEFCEPFITNARDAGFPISRMWTLQSGQAPAQLVVRCPADGADIEYTLLNADGSALESGSLAASWWLRPTVVDFRPTRGAPRLGVYDIVAGTMQLALGAPGAPRPASLAGSAVFSTR